MFEDALTRDLAGESETTDPWLGDFVEGMQALANAPIRSDASALIVRAAAEAQHRAAHNSRPARRRPRRGFVPVLRRGLVFNMALGAVLLIGTAALAIGSVEAGFAPEPIENMVMKVTASVGITLTPPDETPVDVDEADMPGNHGEEIGPPPNSNAGGNGNGSGTENPGPPFEEPPGNRGDDTGPPDNSNGNKPPEAPPGNEDQETGEPEAPPGNEDQETGEPEAPPGNEDQETGPPPTASAGGNETPGPPEGDPGSSDQDTGPPDHSNAGGNDDPGPPDDDEGEGD